METSKRHVGEMSMCVFAVSGAYRPFPGKAASRRGCLLGRKGKVRRLREGLESGVLSVLKRKKSILSVSGRREQVKREFRFNTQGSSQSRLEKHQD